jgi:hypothetical protein
MVITERLRSNNEENARPNLKFLKLSWIIFEIILSVFIL